MAERGGGTANLGGGHGERDSVDIARWIARARGSNLGRMAGEWGCLHSESPPLGLNGPRASRSSPIAHISDKGRAGWGKGCLQRPQRRQNCWRIPKIRLIQGGPGVISLGIRTATILLDLRPTGQREPPCVFPQPSPVLAAAARSRWTRSRGAAGRGEAGGRARGAGAQPRTKGS